MEAVLVTGSSTGIGEATVKLLIEAGRFVFGSVRTQKDADRLKSQYPERFYPLIFDVTDEKAMGEALLKVESVLQEQKLRLVGLVNNAGVVVAGPLEYISSEDLRRQFEINVFGLVTITQLFLPLLKQFKGRVVMVSSVSGKMSFPLLAPYCSSKFALEAISDAWRVELKPFGIEVCVIEPGMTNTPIWEKSLQAAAKNLERSTVGKPASDLAIYQPVIDKVIKNAQQFQTKSTAPVEIAKRINHALFSKRPKTRYVVGSGSKAQVIFARFPDRFRDWLISKALIAK